MRDFNQLAKDRFLLIQRKDRELTKLAIFVHGFRGNYLSTWGGLSNLLKTEADSKPVFEDWDYAFVGYNTYQMVTYLDIAQLVWTQWRNASRGDPPYQHRYTKLALIGHSLGTLGIRQALCANSKHPEGMLKALHRVMFFGSPINGSFWARLSISAIGEALRPGSPQLRMLKGWVDDTYISAPWPEIRLVIGIDDKVVGTTDSELIHWKGDESPAMTNTDHSGLVKPAGWNSRVLHYLEACLK